MKNLIGELYVLIPVPRNLNLWIEAKAIVCTSNQSEKSQITFDEIQLLLAVYKPGHKSDYLKLEVDQNAIELEWKEELIEYVEKNMHKIKFNPDED